MTALSAEAYAALEARAVAEVLEEWVGAAALREASCERNLWSARSGPGSIVHQVGCANVPQGAQGDMRSVIRWYCEEAERRPGRGPHLHSCIPDPIGAVWADTGRVVVEWMRTLRAAEEALAGGGVVEELWELLVHLDRDQPGARGEMQQRVGELLTQRLQRCSAGTLATFLRESARDAEAAARLLGGEGERARRDEEGSQVLVASFELSPRVVGLWSGRAHQHEEEIVCVLSPEDAKLLVTALDEAHEVRHPRVEVEPVSREELQLIAEVYTSILASRTQPPGWYDPEAAQYALEAGVEAAQCAMREST